MVKKQKPQDPFILEIDQKVVDALGISKKSDVEMLLMDDMLIIKSKKKKVIAKIKEHGDIVKLTNRLIDKYEPVLKKLAKT